MGWGSEPCGNPAWWPSAPASLAKAHLAKATFATRPLHQSYRARMASTGCQSSMHPHPGDGHAFRISMPGPPWATGGLS
jgi:hypothetical protein